jgi:hypothetical protein
MEMWREKFKVEMAARTALHVKEYGHRGKLNLDQAMNDVLAIVRGVGDVTVIYISNGEAPMVKTPFDAVINARYAELAPVMKRKKATINTVLAAQDGKLVAWAVNSPDFPVEIPYVPPKPKPAPVVVAKAPAPTPRATNAAPLTVATEAPLPLRPRPNAGPIIITKDIVAQERRQFLALASTFTTNEAGATAAPTNPAPAPVAETISPTTTTTSAPVVTALAPTSSVVKPVALATTPAEKVLQTATNAPTNHAAPTAVTTLTKPETTNVATVTVSVSMPPAAPTTASSSPATANISQVPETHSESSPLLWVAVGAGAALICMLSVMLVMRSRRPEPSLVSQAIIRERMRVS